MKEKLIRSGLCFLLTGWAIGGCSLTRTSTRTVPLKLTEYTNGAVRAMVVPFELDRVEFKQALAQNGSLRGIRFVSLLHGKDEPNPGYPEYRVFGINPGSVYSKLGLENADILIAADGYILDNPGKFPQYVSLLAEEPSGFVNIRRSGNSLQLSYTLR